MQLISALLPPRGSEDTPHMGVSSFSLRKRRDVGGPFTSGSQVFRYRVLFPVQTVVGQLLGQQCDLAAKQCTRGEWQGSPAHRVSTQV